MKKLAWIFAAVLMLLLLALALIVHAIRQHIILATHREPARATSATSSFRRLIAWAVNDRGPTLCLTVSMEADHMTADSIDISEMSRGERVALMERLWRSLSGELETQGPPAWHDAELESWKGEWANRGSLSQEWSAVREELRRELE